MNERLREALRRKIESHNHLVWISSISSAFAVALMWVALYFISHWLLVFGSTVVKGLDATMPQNFNRGFAIAAVGLLVAGWIARRLGLNQRLRDERSAGLVLVDLCLLPARATFGTIQNFRNHIRLSEDDLCAATDFLVRVVRAGKLAITAAPVEIPDDAARDRVLHALQLLDLIYRRKGDPADFFAVADPQRLVPFLSGPVPSSSVA